ncbi:MAG: hypothetical protein IT494_02745 [Gammaproteobacteria bacterium]|nr:hypothetical protein [Gammaproteobacteria bacterium]
MPEADRLAAGTIHVVVAVATSTAFTNGMPGLRIVFAPHPVTGCTTAESTAYLQGNDPVSGDPMLAGVLTGLTGKLARQDRQSGILGCGEWRR